MKTVFITGASSGIGKETAMLFLANGWNVIATMRNPTVESELSTHPNVLLLQCDVTEQQSIENAVAKGIINLAKLMFSSTMQDSIRLALLRPQHRSRLNSRLLQICLESYWSQRKLFHT